MIKAIRDGIILAMLCYIVFILMCINKNLENYCTKYHIEEYELKVH